MPSELEYESKSARRLVERARVHLTVWAITAWVSGFGIGIVGLGVLVHVAIEAKRPGGADEFLVRLFLGALGSGVGIALFGLGELLTAARRNMRAGEIEGGIQCQRVLGYVVVANVALGMAVAASPVLNDWNFLAAFLFAAGPLGMAGLGMWSMRELNAAIKGDKAREGAANGGH